MFQCNTFCNNNGNCSAFKWEETSHKCTILEKDGLCLDKANVDPENVLVKAEDICELICQGNSKLLIDYNHLSHISDIPLFLYSHVSMGILIFHYT